MSKFSVLAKILIRFRETIKLSIFPRINNENADYIIWAPSFFSLKFIASDNFQRVMFSYKYIFKKNKSVSVYTRKDIGRFLNKKIIFFADEGYNEFKFSDYAAQMIFISKSLEQQGNKVFPSGHEASMWENKAYMHDFFDAVGINTPKTEHIKINELSNIADSDFPLLLKEEHSCSAMGVHEVVCKDNIRNLLNDCGFVNNNPTIIRQQLLNIRRDLRVILVGGDIVWFYWRINLSDEWKPTSTGHGSKVDFENFPEKWRAWIVQAFESLGMITGAFDIAWNDDDLESEPYILEVSPFYQPNPKPLFDHNLHGYGDWKKSINLSDNYQVAFVRLMDDIQRILMDEVVDEK